MTRTWTLVVLTVLLAIAGTCGTGCSTTPTTDVTGGVELELFVTREGGSYARYLLEPDGTLHFGGGMDAHNKSYSWSGPLTDEELVRFRAIMDANDDFRRRPAATDRLMSEREYALRVRTDRGTTRYTMTGDCPALNPLRDLFATASRRSNTEMLDRLTPAPSR